jgi:hypothetical protein
MHVETQRERLSERDLPTCSHSDESAAMNFVSFVELFNMEIPEMACADLMAALD